MNNVSPNINDYNSNKKRKILIIFGDMIADVLSNKKLETLLAKLFIQGGNLSISLVFITQSKAKKEQKLRWKFTEVVTVHCNLGNNTHQHDSRVLQTFILNKSLGQL